MLLLPHTALLALVLSLFDYPPSLPSRATRHSTCDAFDHPAAYYDTCAVYHNTSSTHAPLFGSVDSVDGHSAFVSIAAATPQAQPLPTFASLPFLPTLVNSSSATASSPYHLLLLHSATDPFSLHVLPQFHLLARLFPRVRMLAVDCGGEDVYAFHRLINTSVTLPFPLLSSFAVAASSTVDGSAAWWSSLWVRLRSVLSLSSWWSAVSPVPAAVVTAPSLSFSSHYLVRGLPTLLLFDASTVQQPNMRWPRSLPLLVQHVAQATGMQPELLDDVTAAEDEQEAEPVIEDTADEDEADEWDEMRELDVLFGVTGEIDLGLCFGVLGMSVVHWLHRLKDKLDRWEVEAMAVQHVGI